MASIRSQLSRELSKEKSIKSKAEKQTINTPLRETVRYFGDKENRILHSISNENNKYVKVGEIETATGVVAISIDKEKNENMITFGKRESLNSKANQTYDKKFLESSASQKTVESVNIGEQSQAANMVMLKSQTGKKYGDYKKAIIKINDEKMPVAIRAVVPVMANSENKNDKAKAQEKSLETKVDKILQKADQLISEPMQDNFPELMKKKLLEVIHELEMLKNPEDDTER